jgi:hypothetical protein
LLRLYKGHKKVCSFKEFLSRNNMLEKYAQLRQTTKKDGNNGSIYWND